MDHPVLEMVLMPMHALVIVMVIAVLAYVLQMPVLVHAQLVRPLAFIMMNVTVQTPLIVYHKLVH